LRALVRVCGVSEFFGEMLAGNPLLIQVLSPENSGTGVPPVNHAQDARATPFELREFVSTDPHDATFAESLDALRRGWSRLFVEIGARDAQGAVTIEQVNRSAEHAGGLEPECITADCAKRIRAALRKVGGGTLLGGARPGAPGQRRDGLRFGP
jgi:hypothetical protein